jgi:hypothetical protein
VPYNNVGLLEVRWTPLAGKYVRSNVVLWAYVVCVCAVLECAWWLGYNLALQVFQTACFLVPVFVLIISNTH